MTVVPAEKEPSFRIPVKVEIPSQQKPNLTPIEILSNELYSTKNSGLWVYINNINPTDMFIYLVVIQVFILIFSKVNFKLRHLFGFIIGTFIVLVFNERKRTQFVDKMKILEIKMESIVPRPKYFYLDANIIQVMYNILEFYRYSPKNYEQIVKSIDNILLLRLDVEKGLKNCGRMYSVANDNYNNAMNGLIGMMIGIPTNNIQLKKLKLARENLQIMLLRHLDYIKDTCNEQLNKNWNINTTPILDTYKSYDLIDNDMNILF